MGCENSKPAAIRGASSVRSHAAKSSPKQQALIKCGFTSLCSNRSVSTVISSCISLTPNSRRSPAAAHLCPRAFIPNRNRAAVGVAAWAVLPLGNYQAHSRWAPLSLPSSRSNVPSGKCPALRATSSTKQSENPSLGRLRKCSSAAPTTSASCNVRSRWLRNISTAVAIAAGPRSYTAASTHMASASTRCGTHAPLATTASAAATCLASSRVASRTKTLVSTARITPLHIAPYPFLQLRNRPRLWRLREQSSVHILRGIAARSTDYDLLVVFVPFQYGARANTKPPPHFSWYRDLPLSSE